MARRSIRDIENIWSNVEGVKKLSDRVIGIGPFGLGLDAMLTWVPVVGTVYTVGTGGWLMLQAVRAKATPALGPSRPAPECRRRRRRWTGASRPHPC